MQANWPERPVPGQFGAKQPAGPKSSGCSLARAGKFARESDAEDVLRGGLSGVVEAGRPWIPLTAGGDLNKRYVDILNRGARVGYEVKFGKVKASGRATEQALRDQRAVALGSDGIVREVEWHFFADRRGVFGPDEVLLTLLQQTGRPYVIHLP